MGALTLEWRKRVGPVLSLTMGNRRIAFCLCHRREDRSFKILNHTFPICSRCFGLYVGLVLSIILINWSFLFPSLLGVAFMLPLLIDGTTQALGNRESNNTLRFITGVLFSMGWIWGIF